jgi:hypothetical protein
MQQDLLPIWAVVRTPWIMALATSDWQAEPWETCALVALCKQGPPKLPFSQGKTFQMSLYF